MRLGQTVPVKRTRAEQVIGEWGIRDVTPDLAAERARLDADRELNGLLGRPIRRRLRNFRAEADTYIASLGGPLPYMQRLRLIEQETADHLERLEAAHAAHRGDPAGWRRVAARWDFDEVNELIEKHNRWYPIEARLPMDPRSRDFVKVGGRPYRRQPLDAAWVLERFPA
jgi:hypothetical protein